jgi:hypothetical protein
MRKAIAVVVLALALTGPASAGIIQCGVNDPPPPPPASFQSQPTDASTDASTDTTDPQILPLLETVILEIIALTPRL